MCESGHEAQRLSARRGRLLAGLFARQEEERQRIACELRERTLQHLAVLALTLDSLKGDVATAKDTAPDELTRVRALALAVIQDLRRLAADLRPSLLDHLGLAPAVQSYAESRLLDRGIQISFNASDAEMRLSPLLETSLYRVAQEAVDNIATHAWAKTAGVTLRCDGRLLTLAVEDDGKGFEPAEILANLDTARGVGILIMQERTAFVGGTFSVGSAPGEGTRVQVRIPLEGNGKEREQRIRGVDAPLELPQ